MIPTYERAELVSEAIESVLDQDYPRLELVVVDDGSSDATPEVLERYATRSADRMRVERHSNRGFVRSLNRGFELARGEILGILPDDDLLRPGAVSRLVEALVGEPEAILAYSGYDSIGPTGEVLSTVVPDEWSLAEALRLYWVTVAGPGALFHRWACERAGGWTTELRWTSDFDFWLRLGLMGPFVRVAEPMAAKRHHEGADSAALRGPEKARDRILLLERFYARDDLPQEVLAVREEAFRAAYFDAAVSAAPGLNRPGERFYVTDLLQPRLTRVDEEDLVARTAELSHWIRHVELELQERESQLAERDAQLAARTAELAARDVQIAERDARIAELERPAWVRAWARFVPRPVREWAWRTFPRALAALRSPRSPS